MRVLITGGNRGLGLAYARQCLDEGDQVYATLRETSDAQNLNLLKRKFPDQLFIYNANLSSEEDIEVLVHSVSKDTNQLDVLINNAGMLTEDNAIESVTLNNLLDNFAINAAMPVILVQKFLPLLKNSPDGKVINISSSFASISLKNEAMPARYGYSMSKAALNMFTKSLAAELDNISVVSIHPGWVRTDLGGPQARFSPEESARSVLQTIKHLSADQSGQFLTWDGREISW